MALSHLATSCKNVVMIGDTEETDIAGAQSIGIRAIIIHGGESGRSMAWRESSHLLEAVESLLAHNARCVNKPAEGWFRKRKQCA